MGDLITFSRFNLPDVPVSEWPQFRKVPLTRAFRVDGAFVVETSEGRLDCADGWLCIDARGYPYPVAADEFALIYERVAFGQQSEADPALKEPK